MVVLHHVGIAYGTMGSWCFVTSDTMKGPIQVFLSALFGIEAIFSMSLFFFISAYFTPQSLDKKGAKLFLNGQFIRLGIPLLFVMLLLAPGLLFAIEKYNGTTDLSILRYIWIQISQYPHTSHAWFVLVLIGFECIYVLYRKLMKESLSKRISENVPSHFHILIFIVICGLTSFTVRLFYPIGKNFIGLQFGNFTLYILMYSLGILAKRKNWLEALALKITKSWFYVALILTPLFGFTMSLVLKEPSLLNRFVGGMHWEGFIFAFCETIICIGYCAFLLVAFKKFADFTGTLLTKMADNRYAVYIIHSVVVVGVTMILKFTGGTPFLRFCLACIISTAGSFLLGYFLRLIPLVKRIL
jgi:surface polysaccharide O-acyltransferase-like enzyme